MRCRSLDLSVLAFAFTLSLPARADGVQPVHVGYDAPEDCPAADAFVAQVRARTARMRIAGEGEPGLTLRVAIVRAGERVKGTLVVADGSGAESRREVDGEACATVVAALALVAALRIDPMASTAELQAESGPSATAVPVSGAVARPSPSARRDGDTRAPRRHRWRTGIDADPFTGEAVTARDFPRRKRTFAGPPRSRLRPRHSRLRRARRRPRRDRVCRGGDRPSRSRGAGGPPRRLAERESAADGFDGDGGRHRRHGPRRRCAAGQRARASRPGRLARGAADRPPVTFAASASPPASSGTRADLVSELAARPRTQGARLR